MWFSKKKLDVLSVGDVVTDAFIDLLDAQVHCDINNEDCTISMRFGDKIPYRDVIITRAVGNAANASVAARRFNLSSALLATVGGDEEGSRILAQLEKERIDSQFMSIEKSMATNYHYVLRYGPERTILIKHEPYHYKLPVVQLEKTSPAWIYFTTISKESVAFHHELAAWLKDHPETKLAFQPGTFQIQLGTEELKDVYAVTHAFFCNKEEAQRILNKPHADFAELHAGIRALGPKLVIITDGPNGLTASDESGSGWHLPMYPDPKPPVDRTGAGDACSSTIMAALHIGIPFQEALRYGPINSMSVVQYIGAQEGLLSREQIEQYLKQAPADYVLTKLF